VATLIWGFIVPYWGKNVMVVDTDIDIYDWNKISWAFAYRVDPKRDLHIFPGWGSPADPVVHPKDIFTHTWSKMNRLLIDATKPIHENPPSEKWHNERFAPVAYPDAETMRKVNERWGELGIESFMESYKNRSKK
jgi:3-polyprenyl-4-hydroxybenzoate decarboxylase